VGFWPIGKKYDEWVGPNNYYVFVRYNPKLNSLEAFLAFSEEVARSVAQEIENEKKRGCKAWGPCFYPRGELDRLETQWNEFGMGR